MQRVLPHTFFQRGTLDVCRDLIGKVLVSTCNGQCQREIITEVEAYHGFDDRASHARFGKTKRSQTMFESGGYMYVYLIYGIYDMLNIVTEHEGYPAAILIRGVGDYAGPGKLTKGLGITRSVNGQLLGKSAGVWIEDHGITVPPESVRQTSRIGISYAGSEWSKKPYRFVIADLPERTSLV